MKKKLIALLLSVSMLLLISGVPAAAEGDLTFISINDTLPPELINCVTYYGGATYVPYYLFTNYNLGLGYVYLTSSSTAYFYKGDRQLYFELESGSTYDGDDYQYSAPAIMRSGTVYVPLSFTARFFGGLSYSTITGSEYGTVLRITDGTEVLTDAEFLRAATMVMRNYAASYTGQGVGDPGAPGGEGDEIHAGERVSLSFIGMPAAEVLDRLAQDGTTACFFLTAEQLRAAPDTVRRLICEGHRVGVYCEADAAAEYAEFSALLFEAARACTELVTASGEYEPECREAAARQGLVYCGFALNALGSSNAFAITSFLENGSGDTSLCMDCGAESAEQLSIVLNYLRSGKFDVSAPRETD